LHHEVSEEFTQELRTVFGTKEVAERLIATGIERCLEALHVSLV
jgi:hypothetical protein